ncbi:hypothetical protein ADZ37_09600 [Pannonibacter phragmitetus]|uniref:DUF1330 domain-containing protein n=1 Tax=Pannonibacter phragmitetus TaxID=121719 RepID=UPI00067DA025|nr:DUF1330 domain-containing protein [Pannonibacter phragmitetus]KND19272.1 hypothetical protein ADZ37_09600 [Pannonibacter phragmitetus]
MTAYAIARISKVEMGPEIVTYLEKIDGTLAPFGGRFIIHGGGKTVLEGDWTEDLVIIAFPSMPDAQAWYASAAYQAILPLRTENAASDVILMQGVDADHRATDILAN